ncbi:TusE/DsrC/DsvC family sulfur relay protein [Thermoproteus tenax]|uniref:Dissimilatory sulfite reductase, gamma subunit n=1 Tax=Thermoproteus tenax (strain ATCC 35583 / DSM 2078 / JCM 9277 / NBRC 100435 / Kra 1) TaxID=768679 RepID=G4RP00_THETK|nr:TusE/DsrC/DsvC family sulfur relay protein [Thermoproteus tenax]CCC81294.1 dissimilatory sulfite reductase, gamma subunit [Thermoproteus tenax Kra 1]
MTSIKCPGEYRVGNATVSLDEWCFLRDPLSWNEEVAEWLAENLEGIRLTEAHWRVLRYLRSYWEKYGFCPPVKRLLMDLGVTFKDLYDLFPSGPADGACKIAGLPRPGGCV